MTHDIDAVQDGVGRLAEHIVYDETTWDAYVLDFLGMYLLYYDRFWLSHLEAMQAELVKLSTSQLNLRAFQVGGAGISGGCASGSGQRRWWLQVFLNLVLFSEVVGGWLRISFQFWALLCQEGRGSFETRHSKSITMRNVCAIAEELRIARIANKSAEYSRNG